MKAILISLLIGLSCVAYAQQPLTNQDVLSLIKSGLGPELVAAKIRQAGGRFDTSPAVLRQLKEAGVPESVLLAMIETETNSSAPPAARTTMAPSAEPTLPGGTRVEIELAHTVSSADLKEGDPVTFHVVNPVAIDGSIVIERGAVATARVVKAEGGRRWARGGSLTWAIRDVVAVDGQRIPLDFTGSAKGDGKGGSMTAGIVVTGLLFWPAAPLWGLKKGKPAVIPAGKRFDVFTAGDSRIRLGSIRGAAPGPQVAPGRVPVTPRPAPEKTCVFGGQSVPCRP